MTLVIRFNKAASVFVTIAVRDAAPGLQRKFKFTIVQNPTRTDYPR